MQVMLKSSWRKSIWFQQKKKKTLNRKHFCCVAFLVFKVKLSTAITRHLAPTWKRIFKLKLAATNQFFMIYPPKPCENFEHGHVCFSQIRTMMVAFFPRVFSPVTTFPRAEEPRPTALRAAWAQQWIMGKCEPRCLGRALAGCNVCSMFHWFTKHVAWWWFCSGIPVNSCQLELLWGNAW